MAQIVDVIGETRVVMPKSRRNEGCASCNGGERVQSNSEGEDLGETVVCSAKVPKARR